MVTVDESLTRKVAQLARLELTDQEVKTFTGQLKQIIQYVDQLQALDVSQVEPMTSASEFEPKLREDVVHEFPKDEDGKPKVLLSSPDVMYDGYKVPQIV